MKKTYYYYTCPSCKSIDGSKQRYRFRYGSPFRTCRACGTQYINKNFCEIAITGLPDAEKNSLKLDIFILCILVLAVILGYCEVVSEEVMGYALFFMAICLIDLAGVALRVLPAMSASKKRVSDPAYRQKVMDLYRS